MVVVVTTDVVVAGALVVVDDDDVERPPTARLAPSRATSPTSMTKAPPFVSRRRRSRCIRVSRSMLRRMASPAARRMWTLYEPYHAVIYFAPEAAEAFKDAGYKGFWMGYFAARLAPLGAASPEVGTAVCFGFLPSMVARSLPDAWRFAPPVAALDARLSGASGALDALGISDDDVAEAADLAARAAGAVDPAGHILGAANAALPLPETPRLALWQATTTLREHRGDGHLAALTAAGLDGCQAQVFAVAGGADRSWLQRSRGWSDEDWSCAFDELLARELIAEDGTLSEGGTMVRDEIEAQTDAAAEAPWQALGSQPAERLAELLIPLAVRIASDVVPYPNPIGVPLPD